MNIDKDIEIEGFEGETIKCSPFTEKVGKDIIDYKFEYKNNLKIIEMQNKELETWQKIAEKLASTTYDYANLEMLNICPAEHEGKVDLRKCKYFGKDINCIKCIIDWARKEVENENK